MGIQKTSAQTYNLLESFAGSGLQGVFGGATAVYANNPVGTDQVIKITNNGTQTWQGLDVNLATNYRLTAATQLSMQLDVYSTTAITIAPKAQGGVAGAPDSVTTATHNGSGWQTLTFTFNRSLDGKVPANGDYSDFALHINWNIASSTFGAPDGRILYIKNLKGLQVAPPVVAAPTVAAPTPTRNATDVISLYSNAYSNLASWHPGWSQTTTYTEVQIASNSTARLTSFGYEGIATTAPATLNLSTMTTAHFDVWTTNETSIKFYLLIAGEPFVTKTLVANQWNSFDIPLTDFGTGSMTAATGFKLESGTYTWPNGVNTVYVDNVYFWKPAAPVGTPVITGFTVPAKSLGDAPFALTAPTSNSPGAFTYTSSNTSVATILGNIVTIVGVGSSTITANQAASAPFLVGSTTAELIVSPPAAPVPTLAAADVISMYGESYPNTYQYSFGSVAGEPDLDPSSGVNLALKYNFEVAGYGAGYTETNVSTMQFVHFDYFTTNSTNFKFVLISNTPVLEYSYELNPSSIVFNTWKSVNIPMSYFTGLGLNPATWFQFKFDRVAAGNPNIVYIDNVYFTRNNLGVKDFTSSNIRMYPNPTSTVFTIEANDVIDNISLFNVLGQEVLTKTSNSNSVTLDVANLQTGVYVVKSTIGGVISTSKMVKN